MLKIVPRTTDAKILKIACPPFRKQTVLPLRLMGFSMVCHSKAMHNLYVKCFMRRRDYNYKLSEEKYSCFCEDTD